MLGACISIDSLSQPFPSRVIFGTSYIDRFAGRNPSLIGYLTVIASEVP